MSNNTANEFLSMMLDVSRYMKETMENAKKNQDPEVREWWENEERKFKERQESERQNNL